MPPPRRRFTVLQASWACLLPELVAIILRKLAELCQGQDGAISAADAPCLLGGLAINRHWRAVAMQEVGAGAPVCTGAVASDFMHRL